jgi:hypothetical protein
MPHLVRSLSSFSEHRQKGRAFVGTVNMNRDCQKTPKPSNLKPSNLKPSNLKPSNLARDNPSVHASDWASGRRDLSVVPIAKNGRGEAREPSIIVFAV